MNQNKAPREKQKQEGKKNKEKIKYYELNCAPSPLSSKKYVEALTLSIIRVTPVGNMIFAELIKLRLGH